MHVDVSVGFPFGDKSPCTRVLGVELSCGGERKRALVSTTAPAKPQVSGLLVGSEQVFVGVIAFVYSFNLLR